MESGGVADFLRAVPVYCGCTRHVARSDCLPFTTVYGILSSVSCLNKQLVTVIFHGAPTERLLLEISPKDNVRLKHQRGLSPKYRPARS